MSFLLPWPAFLHSKNGELVKNKLTGVCSLDISAELHMSSTDSLTLIPSAGLHFVELNFASATEKCQIAPMGFDILFPAMLDYARCFSLDLHLEQTTFNDLMHKRDLELKR